MEFIVYNKCGSCLKAKKYLMGKGVDFTIREITEEPLTLSELEDIHQAGNIPISRLLNITGVLYRELGMKDRLKSMKDEEVLRLLSENPMLVKRPIARLEDGRVLIGFDEKEWEKVFG